MNNRIIYLSKKDKLWELYLHTLSGYHANMGANSNSNTNISETALQAARNALKVWEEQV